MNTKIKEFPRLSHTSSVRHLRGLPNLKEQIKGLGFNKAMEIRHKSSARRIVDAIESLSANVK